MDDKKDEVKQGDHVSLRAAYVGLYRVVSPQFCSA